MRDDSVQRAALVALLQQAREGWSRVTTDVLECGDAVKLLTDTVGRADTLFPDTDGVTQLLHDADQLLGEWEASGIGVHTIFDSSYPSQLRDIREQPPIVFTRGSLAGDARAIAVVGTRRATERGLQIARTIAAELASRHVTVVSGLAAGIDTAAHKATLASGGRTVAVIGTGIRRHFPAENRELQEQIAQHGLVISQFWPDAPVRRQQFLMRNAVMSGYAAATVVVEAGLKSGARNQAGLALKHGRPVVLLGDLLQQEWAADLARKPGVHVAVTPDDLFATVCEILRQRMVDLDPEGAIPDVVIT